MSIDIYDEQAAPARPPRRHRKLFQADTADDLLEQVVKYVAEKAPWNSGVTPDAVAVPLLELLPDLHPGAIAALVIVAAALAEQSKI
jgi:hypothetical protein